VRRLFDLVAHRFEFAGESVGPGVVAALERVQQCLVCGEKLPLALDRLLPELQVASHSTEAAAHLTGREQFLEEGVPGSVREATAEGASNGGEDGGSGVAMPLRGPLRVPMRVLTRMKRAARRRTRGLT